MTVHPVALANSFISRFGEPGSVDHLKLQKLCYFAYGWWLALAPDEPALLSSRPQVWKLGPVFRPIYSSFAKFSDSYILKDSIQHIGPFDDDPPLIQRGDTRESKIVDWIWSKYGSYSGLDLSEMTHESDTPWYDIAKEHNFVVPRFYEMPDDKVRAYFDRLGRQEGIIQ